MYTDIYKPSFINAELSINETHDIHQLRLFWKQLSEKAHSYYKKSSFPQAATAFNQCIEISKRLISDSKKLKCETNDNQSDVERLYFASHNLAACQNIMHKGTAAEQTLLAVYKEITNLCQSSEANYDMKLEALAALDKCVFSLASQFAYLGKIDRVHELLMAADEFGENQLNTLALSDVG